MALIDDKEEPERGRGAIGREYERLTQPQKPITAPEPLVGPPGPLEGAPEPVPGAKLDFTEELRRQKLLPNNWPQGVSVFQDAQLAVENLPPQRQELLTRELMRFLPPGQQDSLWREMSQAAGGKDSGLIPLTEEEWQTFNQIDRGPWWKQTGGVILGGLARFTDGPIIGDIMDGLEWPSDRLEQVLGTALYPSWSGHWWWDAPDGYSILEMSSLYYDVLAGSVAHSGLRESNMLHNFVNDVYVGKPWTNPDYEDYRKVIAAGLPWEKDIPEPGLKQKYEQGWTDAMMKGILDPLWLVGGAGLLARGFRTIPIVSKTAKTLAEVEKLAAAGKAAEASAKLSEVSRLGRLSKAGVDILEFGAIGGGAAPFSPYKIAPLRKIAEGGGFGSRLFRIGMAAGLNAYEADIEKAWSKATDIVGRAAYLGRKGQSTSFVGRLSSMSNESLYNRLVRETGVKLATIAESPNILPGDMGSFLEAVRTGDVTGLAPHLPARAAQTEWAAELGLVLNAHNIRPNQFKSLGKEILDPTEFDRLAAEAADKGPKEAKAFINKYSRGHEMWRNEFLSELGPKVYKAIGAFYDWNGGGMLERITAIQKKVLGFTLLQTPGFAELNIFNNIGTGAWHEGANLLDGGIRKATKKALLQEYGFTEGALDLQVGEHMMEDFLGLLGAGRKMGRGGRWARAVLQPFGSIAAYSDTQMRLSVFTAGVRRTFRHNYSKIMTPIPAILDDIASPELAREVRALADSAAEPGFEGRVADMVRRLEQSQGFATSATLRDKWIQGVLERSGLESTPQRVRLMQEQFDELGLTGHIDEAFKATNLEEFERRLEVIDAGLESMADRARHMQQLEPTNWGGVVEDIPTLTDRQRWVRSRLQGGYDANGVLLEKATDPAEIAQLEAETQELRQRIRAANGNTATNMHRIDIAEDKLGATRIQMAQRWLARYGFNQGVTKKPYEQFLKNMETMYRRQAELRQGIQDAYAAGAKGINKKWAAYWEERIQGNEAIMDELEALVRMEREDLLPQVKLLRENRLQMLRAKDAAMREAFKGAEDVVTGPTRHRIDRWIQEEIYYEADIMGLSPTRRTPNLGGADGEPIMAEAITGDAMWAKQFLGESHDELVRMFLTPPGQGELPIALVNSLRDWGKSAVGDYNDLKLAALHVGRSMADWVMHDYTWQTNLDRYIQLVMPYHFWPTRTMWRWAQRSMSNPGLVAGLALSYDMMEHMHQGLPDRFKGDFEIPIPFLGDKLAAAYGPMTKGFFNPLPMVFPTMQWQQDFSFDSRQNTLAGRALDFWSRNGPAPSPFVTMAGGLVGLLDKEEWVNRSWPRSLPFGLPGTTAQMAIWGFLNGDDSAQLPDWLGDDDMGQLIGGGNLPLNKLQRILGVPDDKWDTYRIDRSLQSAYVLESRKLHSEEDRKELLRQYVQGAYDKSGPLWQKARKLASNEAGLRWLTSWAMGSAVSIYPEGEQMMRALDVLYRQYAKDGRLDEFFDRWPEYQLRQVAQAGYLEGADARRQEAATSLFWYDLGVAMDQREKELDPIRAAITAVQSDEKFFNTKTGRLYRDMFLREQSQYLQKWQDEINAIYARYADVDKTPSPRHDPFTRALMSLRNEYYDMRLEDFLPEGVARDKATPEQIDAADAALEDARERFVMSLPVPRLDPRTKFIWAVENQSTRLLTGVRIATAQKRQPDKNLGTQIREWTEERDLRQDALLEAAKRTVSRYDFEQFLHRDAEPPSAVQKLWEQAREEMNTYMAMADLQLEPVGVTVLKTKVRRQTETERIRELRKAYWESHPLLERFYGNEPIDFTTVEAAAAYARLREIYSEYFEKSGMERLDYVYSVREELDEILDNLGLPGVDLRKLGIADPIKWDLSIPGIGFPPMEKLESSINVRYSNEALNPELAPVVN